MKVRDPCSPVLRASYDGMRPDLGPIHREAGRLAVIAAEFAEDIQHCPVGARPTLEAALNIASTAYLLAPTVPELHCHVHAVADILASASRYMAWSLSGGPAISGYWRTKAGRRHKKVEARYQELVQILARLSQSAEYGITGRGDAYALVARWGVVLAAALAEGVAAPSLHPELHPETEALVDGFAFNLKVKLEAAERKYGLGDRWRTDDWESDCRTGLSRQVEKGDPLDVAAYAAFCWAHGWSTTPPRAGVSST